MAANWFENLKTSISHSKEGSDAQNNCGPKRIRAAEFRTLQAEKPALLLLDVRNADEFRSGHIPGSKLIPVHQLSANVSLLPTEKDYLIVVYCQSGGRSCQAARTLTQLGYTQVYDLGGIASWPYEKVSG